MPDTYILLKDLPGVPNGTKSEIMDQWYTFSGKTDRHHYTKSECDAHPDWFFPQTEAPPLGVMPEFIHKEHRLKDLNEAKDRYYAAGMEIPEEWQDECILLEAWIEARNNPKNLERKYHEDDLRKAFEAGRGKATNQIGIADYSDGDIGLLYAYKYTDWEQYLKTINE